MQELEQMIETSTLYDQYKVDYIDHAREFMFNDGAMLVPPGNMMVENPPPLMLTLWAWNQVFSKLGPAVFGHGSGKSLPSDYLLTIPPDLLATNLNRHLNNANGREWMVRAFQNIGRAILSSDYSRIPNTELLQAINLAVDAEASSFPDLELVRPYIDADDLNLKILWKDITGTNYGIGAYMGNGEIGNRKFRILPFIKRTSCNNSIIMNSENGLELIHRGSPRSMMVQIKAAIGNIFNLSAGAVDLMIEAEGEKIPNFADVIEGLSEKYGWSEEITNNAMLGTEGQQTRAGLVNGVSYAARELEKSNDQIDMEILAGTLLTMDPNKLNRIARIHQARERQEE